MLGSSWANASWVVTSLLTLSTLVFVPVFWGNMLDTKYPHYSSGNVCRMDLDVIRNALNLHDAQNPPLSGTTLQPLLGRYLQELPNDFWGSPYLVDTSVGVLCSYGADGQAGGVSDDSDGLLYYKPPLKICRVQYEGEFGVPREGNKFFITMTKPFLLKDEQEFLCRLNLLTNIESSPSGAPIAFDELNDCCGHDWQICKKKSNPEEGLIVLVNESETNEFAPPVTPKMALNFDTSEEAVGADPLERFGLREAPLAGGPLDAELYGRRVQEYLRRPDFSRSYCDEFGLFWNRGVKIERF